MKSKSSISLSSALIPLYLILLQWADGIEGDATVKSNSETVDDDAAVIPSFDVEGSPNVTAALGKTALLTCRIKGMNNRTQVAWIRHRDLHLLTVGNVTYTSDARFASNPPSSAYQNDDGGDALTSWSLQIRNVQPKDQGVYECQVGMTPHVSRFIHLAVVEPTTTILGGSEMHINVGSTINLTCLVKHSPDPPAHVFWTHNQQTVNYDSARGGISVLTEKGEMTLSSLLIQKARPQDSGMYVCSPSSAPAAVANIHVLAGERPAAMYSKGWRLYLSWILLTIMSVCLFIVHGQNV